MSRGGLAALAAAAMGFVLYPRARRGVLTWGATEDEVRAVLPGDELAPNADVVATRAVDIDAAPCEVWPWLAQIGSGRGGMYSYDALENVVGCEMTSADDVVPEWQDIQVGDVVHLHPDVPLPVAVVEKDRALVLHGTAPTADLVRAEGLDDTGDEPSVPFDFVWAFVLVERPDGRTRLLVRERYAYRTPWAGALVEPVSWVSWFMTERMLRGIKERAERLARPTAV